MARLSLVVELDSTVVGFVRLRAGFKSYSAQNETSSTSAEGGRWHSLSVNHFYDHLSTAAREVIICQITEAHNLTYPYQTSHELRHVGANLHFTTRDKVLDRIEFGELDPFLQRG